MSQFQRESPILAQLCTLLIDDQYGELASRVFSILARHGRQTLAALSRNSYLSGKQLKHGLVILIQQNLLFHSSPGLHHVTYYEINWQQSYALIRYGRMTKMVEDRFGEKASAIISNLVSLGHTRIGDLNEAYFPSNTSDHEEDEEDADTHMNGTAASVAKGNGSTQLLNGTESSKASKTKINASTEKAELQNKDVNSDKVTTDNANVNGDAHTNGKMNGTASVNGEKPAEGNGVTEGQHASKSEVNSLKELHGIIYKLMVEGWIVPVTEAHFLPPHDFHEKVLPEIVAEVFEGRWPSGTKKQTQLKIEVNQRKRYLRDSSIQAANRKRSADLDLEFGRPSKRMRIACTNGDNISTSAQNEYAQNETILDDNLVIRFNLEKLNVAMRTEQLVLLAKKRLGKTTARVYHTLLCALEQSYLRCYEEWPDPPEPEANTHEVDPKYLVTAKEVTRKLDRNIDLTEGLDPHVVINHIGGRFNIVEKDRLTYIDPPADPSELSIDQKCRLVDAHLRLLYQEPFQFVTWYARRGFSQWRVEFDRLCAHMIQQEIENTIMARRDHLGVKLVRALQKKGRLDERGTCVAMMMPAQEIRTVVNEMCLWGFIQTQEIPRVESRMTKHSMHLIWYDKQRARERLLHDTYRGMTRIMQRMAMEKEKVRPVIDKAERSDVVGNEDKYLNQAERDALKKWGEVEEKLLVQLSRQDQLVAILRDFIGPLSI
ncbi:hypothetical protein K469DRAFT_695009 [Zopfia rhizophila CBS 207.26]|uniref:DNA-directed RNA polymerase III subunit RPC3 n=1 Tax=Zopfia rhizophila CBS 207.26 TaxID=1314779 RepID=A0A6A6DHZ4_9PEZI|nr:hypothetical protein K469DRAFT_695009 [Zopfia rhizophila CBS 207.26]